MGLLKEVESVEYFVVSNQAQVKGNLDLIDNAWPFGIEAYSNGSRSSFKINDIHLFFQLFWDQINLLTFGSEGFEIEFEAILKEAIRYLDGVKAECFPLSLKWAQVVVMKVDHSIF